MRKATMKDYKMSLEISFFLELKGDGGSIIVMPFLYYRYRSMQANQVIYREIDECEER